MTYEKELVWQPVWLNGMQGANFKIILDKEFAKRCLEKELTREEQNNFNQRAKEVAREKFRVPFSFYKKLFL